MLKNKIRITFFVIAALASVAFAVQKDWITMTSKEGSLSMSVPPSWVVADMNDPNTKAAYDKIKQNNPKLAQSMDASMSDKYILSLIDTNVAAGDTSADVVNIAKQKSGGLTTKMYGDVAKEVAKGLPLKGKLESKTYDLPVGKSLSYWGTIKITTPEGEDREMDLLGTLFLKGEDVYVITFMTGGKLKQKRENWDKMLKAMKVGT